MDAAASLWEYLSAAGGSAALAFIVALVVGINALTVLYLGSAVVVLERFARVARRPTWLLAIVPILVWATAVIALRTQEPELSVRPWPEWFASFWPLAGQIAVGTLVSIGACWCLLRFVSGGRLATLSLLVLGIAASLYIGALAQPGFALAPFAVAGGSALLLRAWRGAGGEVQRLLWWLCAAFVPGLLLAFGLAAPEPRAAMIGASVASAYFSLVLFGLLPLAAAGLLELRRSAEWFIAVRYLIAKRRQVFISAITMICVGGIAAGVWLIITVLSVMNGFEKTWRDEIVGNRAHFTVHSGFGPFEDYDSVLEVVSRAEGVTGVSPYLDAEGMVRGREGDIYSVRVRGIDPERVGDVTDLRSDVIVGSIDALSAAAADGNGGPPGIVVGSQLASAVGVSVGDSLLLISPYGGAPTPLGPAPRLKRFDVVGVFQSSFFQYDEVYTYVGLHAAQDFRKSGDVVDGLEARTTDFYRSRRVASGVIAALDYPFYSRDWKDYFPAFFQALKTERVMMFMLLTMIMVVAAFVIVATLIMMIMEKSSDISILKAMGAEDESIERIFAIEGTLIGLAGTVIGVLAGIAVTNQLGWIQEQIESLTGIDTLPASVYQFSTLPSQVDPVQVAFVAMIAMVLSLGATLLPSRQGARLDPVEGLRHE